MTEEGLIMKLRTIESMHSSDIAKYIEMNDISRENIETIVYDTKHSCFCLFYWEDEPEKK